MFYDAIVYLICSLFSKNPVLSARFEKEHTLFI